MTTVGSAIKKETESLLEDMKQENLLKVLRKKVDKLMVKKESDDSTSLGSAIIKSFGGTKLVGDEKQEELPEELHKQVIELERVLKEEGTQKEVSDNLLLVPPTDKDNIIKNIIKKVVQESKTVEVNEKLNKLFKCLTKTTEKTAEVAREEIFNQMVDNYLVFDEKEEDLKKRWKEVQTDKEKQKFWKTLTSHQEWSPEELNKRAIELEKKIKENKSKNLDEKEKKLLKKTRNSLGLRAVDIIINSANPSEIIINISPDSSVVDSLEDRVTLNVENLEEKEKTRKFKRAPPASIK